MAVTTVTTAWKTPKSATYSKYGEYCAAWASTGNIVSRNNAGAVLPSGEGINSGRKTAYLVGYNYSMAIPTSATIKGIQVRIRRSKTTNGGTAKDYLLALRNGTTSSRGYIGRNFARGTLWTHGYSDAYYGGSTDNLGAALTPAVVNSSTFGVVLRAVGTVGTYSNVGVDCIEIRITYTIVTDTQTPAVVTPNPDPDLPPDVSTPVDAPYYGKNLIPYEISAPTTLMSDYFTTGDAQWDTMHRTSYTVSLFNDYYKVKGAELLLDNQNNGGEDGTTTGWSALSTATISNSTFTGSGFPVSGTHSILASCPGTSNAEGVMTTARPTKPSTSYRAKGSFVATSGKQVRIYLVNDDGMGYVDSGLITTTGGVQTFDITGTTPSNNTNTRIYIRFEKSASPWYSGSIYVDGWTLRASYTRLHLCYPRSTNNYLNGDATYKPFLIPATANQQYTFQGTMYNDNGTDGMVIIVDWFTSSETWISQSASSNYIGSDGKYIKYVTATAPSNAVYCSITFQCGALDTDKYMYVKNIQMNTGSFTNYRPSRYHVTPYNQAGSATQSTLNGIYNDWVNPNNARTEDNTAYAYSTMNAHTGSYAWKTEYLMMYNYGFTIPTDAHIDGIETTFRHRTNTAYSNWAKLSAVYLMHNSPGVGYGYDNFSNNLSDGTTANSLSWLNKTIGGPTNKWRGGTEHGNWASVVDDPAFYSSSNFGIMITYENASTTYSTRADMDSVKLRIFYSIAIPRQTVLPTLDPIDISKDGSLSTSFSQAPTQYLHDILPIQIKSIPNQIRRQLGYIGMVTLDRGHHFENITRKNDLVSENAGGFTNFSKSGTISEDRPLKINVPMNRVKTLEGLVDIQNVIPINTVIDMDINDPYAMKGYGILTQIQHSRVNQARALADMDVYFVTKDLNTPLTVDYAIRTTPPAFANMIPSYQNSLIYLEDADLSDIVNQSVASGNATVTYDVNGATIAMDSMEAQAYYCKTQFSPECKFVTVFTKSSTADANHYIRQSICDSLNATEELLVVKFISTTVEISTPYADVGTNRTVTIADMLTATDITCTIDVGIDLMATVTIDVNHGGTITTYTESGINIKRTGYNANYKSKLQFVNNSPSVTYTDSLKTYGLTYNMFTDNTDTGIRNVVHIPESDKTNITYDFTRLTEEGLCYCYINPVRDILFQTDPSKFFDGSVKLYNQAGTQLLANDMAIDNNDTLTLTNGIIKIIIDLANKTIDFYGFLYGWISIGRMILENTFHAKPVSVSLDCVSIQVGETTWTLRRGKPYVVINHPYDDLEISTLFNTYWHDNGDGIGITHDIELQTEPLNMGTLFYANMYQTASSIGMMVFRPNLDNFACNKITKSTETGIGWYNKLGTGSETHYNIALEYLARSTQDIFVQL